MAFNHGCTWVVVGGSSEIMAALGLDMGSGRESVGWLHVFVGGDSKNMSGCRWL